MKVVTQKSQTGNGLESSSWLWALGFTQTLHLAGWWFGRFFAILIYILAHMCVYQAAWSKIVLNLFLQSVVCWQGWTVRVCIHHIMKRWNKKDSLLCITGDVIWYIEHIIHNKECIYCCAVAPTKKKSCMFMTKRTVNAALMYKGVGKMFFIATEWTSKQGWRNSTHGIL